MSLPPPGVKLDENSRMLLSAVRDYAEGELLALEPQWDVSDSSVSDVLVQLGEMGLLSLSLPEDAGGLGCSFRLYASIIHEISYYSPSTAVTLSVHNMVAKILAHRAPDSFKQEFLPAMGDPANFAAFCLSEAGAGSDASATQTSATPVDGGYVLNGEKMWITNGMRARWFLTLARLDGDLCAMLVDGESDGIERTRIHGKMGIRGSETAVISLSGCFVPQEYRLGETGEGLGVFLGTLNEGRIGIASQSTGIAEACLDEMVSYARQREQFGRPICRFPAVADMIAQRAADYEASRLLTWRAACAVDSGEPCRAAASMAKLFASETCNRVAYDAVQIHGGSGYVNECRVERLYRDARVTTIYEGTSEIQRVVIARELSRGRLAVVSGDPLRKLGYDLTG